MLGIKLASLIYALFLLVSLFPTHHCKLLDKEVEEGENWRGLAYGSSKKVVRKIKQSRENKEWVSNRSCRNGSNFAMDSCVSSRENPGRCFSVDIDYNHIVESDADDFPQSLEFLEKFPKCWSKLAPLVCAAHFRPCSNATDLSHNYSTVLVEIFSTKLCHEMHQSCGFALAQLHDLPSYLKCDSRNQSIYRPDCKINFYNQHESLHSLSTQLSSCFWPLVYVHPDELIPHVSPIIDACHLPCDSTLHSAESLRHLNVFSTFCYSIVSIVALWVIRRMLKRRELVFFFLHPYMFIYLLSLICIFVMAFVLGLSSLLGEAIVCLHDEQIRRPSFEDIDRCTLMAFWLKFLILFSFWSSFVIACDKSTKSLRLQFFGVFHAFLCPFIGLFSGEIQIDPITKICHFFRPQSSKLIASELLSFLIVGLIIHFIRSRNGKQMDTIESSEPFLETKTALKDEEQSDSIDPSVSATAELPPNLRFFILHSKQLLVRFAPFFLCTIQFLWVLSFYLLNNMEKEKDIFMANINCSLERNLFENTGSKWQIEDTARALKSVTGTDQCHYSEFPSFYFVNCIFATLNLLVMITIIGIAAFKYSKEERTNNRSNRDGASVESHMPESVVPKPADQLGSFDGYASIQNSYCTLPTVDPGKYLIQQWILQQQQLDLAQQQQQLKSSSNPSLPVLPFLFNTNQPSHFNLNEMLPSNAEWIQPKTQSLPGNFANVDQQTAMTNDIGQQKSGKRRKIVSLENSRGRYKQRRRSGTRTTDDQIRNSSDLSCNTELSEEISELYAAKYLNSINQGHLNGTSTNTQTIGAASQATTPIVPVIVLNFLLPINPQEQTGNSEEHNHTNDKDAMGEAVEKNEHESIRQENEEGEGEYNDDSSIEPPRSESASPTSSTAEERDSNEFCSDNSDSEEERIWNEKCRNSAKVRS